MRNPSKILIFYLGFALMLLGSVNAAQIWEQPYDIENDLDLDHLTTSEELELGTDPNNRDTGGDGLTDGNEFLLNRLSSIDFLFELQNILPITHSKTFKCNDL